MKKKCLIFIGFILVSVMLFSFVNAEESESTSTFDFMDGVCEQKIEGLKVTTNCSREIITENISNRTEVTETKYVLSNSLADSLSTLSEGSTLTDTCDGDRSSLYSCPTTSLDGKQIHCRDVFF